MIFLLLNVLITVAAAALWSCSPSVLLVSFLFGYCALWLGRYVISPSGRTGYFRILPQSLFLAGYFVKELFLSCVNVALDCVSPRPKLHPAIIKMPLSVKSDLEIFLVSNLISLTPGTLTLDVAPDRSFLIIHSMYAKDPDALAGDLKAGMEHRVREVFR